MIRTVIIEDEIYIRKGLKTLLYNLDKDIEIVGEFSTVRDSVKNVNKLKPELVLLDIQLLDGTGFDFLDKIKILDFNIIFITSYDDYAIKAIKSGAMDYILKPIDIDELEIAIDKVISLRKQDGVEISSIKIFEKKLILNFVNGTQLVDLEKLLYCKSDKGYTTFYMLNGKEFLASKSLKKFEAVLEKNNFIRTHQSYYINSLFIDKFDSKKRFIYLLNNIEIPVSARKISKINSMLNKYITNIF